MADRDRGSTVRHGPWAGTVANSDGDGTNGGNVSERLAKLEGVCDGLRGAIEGLRHSHNVLLGAVGIGFAVLVAIIIALGTYTLVKIDNLPGDFARTNQMLSQAITAAKQQPPQVILIPAQQQPPPTPQKH